MSASRKGLPMELTQQKLKELVFYDAETGEFQYVDSRRKSPLPRDDGYIRIRLFRRCFYAHRLAWLYVYGSMPKHQLDHINCIRSDNRIANLREATNMQNSWNRKLQSNNIAGVKGVSKLRSKWRAMITIADKKIILGCFQTIAEAAAAYQAKAKEVHGEFYFNR